MEEGQPARPVRQPQLDPASDGTELLGLGACLLCLQLPNPAAGQCVVGQVHNGPVGGARLGLGVCARGRILRLHLSGVDGGFPVVGHRDLQDGVRLDRLPVQDARPWGAVWGVRVLRRDRLVPVPLLACIGRSGAGGHGAARGWAAAPRESFGWRFAGAEGGWKRDAGVGGA